VVRQPCLDGRRPSPTFRLLHKKPCGPTAIGAAAFGLPLRAAIREMAGQTQEDFKVSPPRKMGEQKQAEAWTLNPFDTLKREL